MSDDPKQPPPLPLHLVRPWTPRELALQQQLQRARDDLQAQQALVEVLQNQPSNRASRSEEQTLPGLGAIARAPRMPTGIGLATGPSRRRMWALIGGAVIGLAAGLASLRYPGLMGPIKDFAAALTEAIQQQVTQP